MKQVYTVYTPTGIDISRFNCISVEQLYIEFSQPIRNSLIDVCTSLIDKTPNNPKQIIASDFLEKSSKFFWLSSTTSETYKIQCRSLEESLFQIHVLEDNQREKKIKKIRLVLKFNE